MEFIRFISSSEQIGRYFLTFMDHIITMGADGERGSEKRDKVNKKFL
jgi:hypothetical protein